mgnify:FL=1
MPASAFSLYCEPLKVSYLGDSGTFNGTCQELEAETPDAAACFPFWFYYKPSDKYGRMESGAKSDFQLLSSTPYQYNFQEVGKTGFDDNASLSIMSDLTIDRRSLEYTYNHGISASDVGLSYFYLEKGECALIEEEIEKPKI